MVYALAAAGAALAAALGFLLIRALGCDGFEFWPPPRRRSWQDYTFWGLFRGYCAVIVLAGPLDHTEIGWNHWSRLAVGLLLLVLGSLLTLHGYSFLGLDNTYGRKGGLVTRGIYAYSRNPQYIASVAAAVGWALTMDSAVTMALAAGLLGLYTLFALNEEAWLSARYGERYRDYMRAVPRFLGIRSAARARRALLARL